MITDKENTFLDRVVITASGTVGDQVRINNRQRNPNLELYIQQEGTLNNATSIRLQIVSSAAADLSSPTTLLDTGVVALATWNATAGSRTTGRYPSIAPTHVYIGVIATLVGTAPTTGAFTAGIVETAIAETAARPAFYTGLT